MNFITVGQGTANTSDADNFFNFLLIWHWSIKAFLRLYFIVRWSLKWIYSGLTFFKKCNKSISVSIFRYPVVSIFVYSPWVSS